jgi:DNA primase
MECLLVINSISKGVENPCKIAEKTRNFIESRIHELVWAANLADLEQHTFLHRAPAIGRPTALAFDLDPGAPADILLCCRVSMWLRAILDDLGLQSFAKTSGSKGLQVFVPLNTATTYEKTKRSAHALAERLEREHPDEVVSRMRKALRKGKVTDRLESKRRAQDDSQRLLATGERAADGFDTGHVAGGGRRRENGRSKSLNL